MTLILSVLVIDKSSGGVVFLDLLAVRKVCSSEDRKRWNGLLVDASGLEDLVEAEMSRAANGFDGSTKGLSTEAVMKPA